jgi:hypothetical protein
VSFVIKKIRFYSVKLTYSVKHTNAYFEKSM